MIGCRVLIMVVIAVFSAGCAVSRDFSMNHIPSVENVKIDVEKPILINVSKFVNLPYMHSAQVNSAFYNELKKKNYFTELETLLKQDPAFKSYVISGGSYEEREASLRLSGKYYSNKTMSEGFKLFARSGKSPPNNRYTVLIDFSASSKEESIVRSFLSALTALIIPFNRLVTMDVRAVVYEGGNKFKDIELIEKYKYSYGLFSSDKAEKSNHVITTRKLVRALVNEINLAIIEQNKITLIKRN